jgi:hypothetical protein
MIFTKQYIAEALERKIQKNFHLVHPYETAYKEGDKTHAHILIQNYFQAFDLKSSEIKDKVYQSRKQIVENCFNDESLGVYPNETKINDCIKNTHNSAMKKYNEVRHSYFGNGIYY